MRMFMVATLALAVGATYMIGVACWFGGLLLLQAFLTWVQR